MNWYETLINTLIGIAAGVVGMGWFAKRKAQADAVGKEKENEGAEVNNFTLQVKAINDIIDTWRSGYSDLKAAYDIKYSALQEQYNYVNDRLNLLNNVVEKNTSMQSEIETLQSRVKVLEAENVRLKNENQRIKAEISLIKEKNLKPSNS